MKEKVKSKEKIKIVFDKKLENLTNKNYFPEKLALANEILRTAGLPKELRNFN